MKLVEIDLSKGIENEHPDINETDNYLAFINEGYQVGQFCRVWFGWNFNSGWGACGAGVQFDTPGFNSSRWKKLWKLVEEK